MVAGISAPGGRSRITEDERRGEGERSPSPWTRLLDVCDNWRPARTAAGDMSPQTSDGSRHDMPAGICALHRRPLGSVAKDT